MPFIDDVYYTDDEYREEFGDPGPDRPDFEARGYRDDYPDAVQDVEGHNYSTEPGAYSGESSSGVRTREEYERDARQFLENTSRATGASINEGDLEQMMRYFDTAQTGTTTQAQLQDFNRKLTEQYTMRGKNVPGGSGGGGGGSDSGGSSGGRSGGTNYSGPGTQGVFQGPVQQVGQDPFSQLITNSYGDLIENQGITADSRAVLDRLMGLIESRGRLDEDPSLYAQRFEAARQPIDAMRRMQINQARGSLANRGLLSEPGMPQGSEISAMGRTEEGLAPYYATAAQNLASEMAGADNDRLSQALTLATGLTQAQSQNYLNALSGATDRQKVLSDIALGTLDRNILWNQFLANYGMDRDEMLENMTSGRIEDLMTILALFQQYVNASTNGYV